MINLHNIATKNSLLRCLHISLLLSALLVFSSCSQDFLKEEPLDFYSPGNSFVTYDDFDAALISIYSTFRQNFYQSSGATSFSTLAWGFTDLSYPHKDFGPNPDIFSLLLPTNSEIVYEALWVPAYRIIYDANVILERIDSENNELTDQQKNKFRAEARFFRGYAHKLLANIYGDVPLVLEELKEPKRDYTRTPRKEVYEQCISDLEFAAQNLPAIGEVEVSRLNKLAAKHVLSELYITLERWQDAINSATDVIDHPATGLMTQRFGTRVDDPDFGGDVYWDLFRKDNQARSIGNTESIWVIPFAYNTQGGGSGGPGVRCQVPRLWQLKVINEDGSAVALTPHPNENYYGRGGGFMRPSPYFLETIWQKDGDDQDIRNSKYNLVRDFKVDNPASDHDGEWLIKDNLPYPHATFTDTMRDFYPIVAKGSTPGEFPDELLIDDQTVPGSISHADESKRTWRDYYAIRLAETYLLRAEAYLGQGNQSNAARDINIVRSRAQAQEIDASMVDIDFILDERMRELHFETLYLSTLGRLGKVVERTKENHPYVGKHLSDYHNLWPIPFNDLEKNIEEDIEQNPGY